MKNKEMELWKTWRETGNKEVFNQLVKRYEPVLYKKFSEFSAAPIPNNVLKSQIQKSIVKSFQKYDPKRGVKLNTFVFSRLPEVNKFVYKYQNVGRIPVNRIVHFNTFQTAEKELEDKLKRSPDDYELADELGWNVKDVRRMRREIKKDFLSSQMVTTIFDEYSEDDDLVHLLYFELDEKEKAVYNRLLGMNGIRKFERDQDIARDLGISNAMVTKIKKRIADKAKKYQ